MERKNIKLNSELHDKIKKLSKLKYMKIINLLEYLVDKEIKNIEANNVL